MLALSISETYPTIPPLSTRKATAIGPSYSGTHIKTRKSSSAVTASWAFLEMVMVTPVLNPREGTAPLSRT